MSVACVVIASKNREALLDTKVMPSVLAAGFDEIVVVGEYHSGQGYRHLSVPPIWGNTNDALIKRDVGTVATESDFLFYLSDDHAVRQWKFDDRWTTCIGVPARVTVRSGHEIPLPMGLPNYCGGHGGLYHRSCIADVPWTLGPLHRNWDAIRSAWLTQRGYAHVELPGIVIEDVDDINTEPWK